MTPRPRPVRLPREDDIRHRLAELARESNALRALLRIVRRRRLASSRGVADAR